MIFLDQIKAQLGIMVHPGARIKKGMKVGEALGYYYKTAVIPMVIFIILGLVFKNVGSFSGLEAVVGAGNSSFLVVLLGLFIFLVLEPLGLLIDSAIFHLFGKYVFRKFRQDWSVTFTAMTYSVATVILFYWLSVIPVVGTFLLLVFSLWGLIVLIIGLSKLQKISGMASLGVVIGTVVIVAVVALIIAIGVAAAFLG